MSKENEMDRLKTFEELTEIQKNFILGIYDAAEVFANALPTEGNPKEDIKTGFVAGFMACLRVTAPEQANKFRAFTQ